jgi:hypothetical protein
MPICPKDTIEVMGQKTCMNQKLENSITLLKAKLCLNK